MLTASPAPAMPTPTPALATPAIPTPAFPISRRGIRAVPLRGGRWRVTRDRGDVLGYVDLIDDPRAAGDAPRFRSSRMAARSSRLIPLGEFADARDALDAVRLG
ncbi:MAG: hypothetical protein HY996_08270 [Micrococcales bacterium]|nr:hypothetical protein [Micrococcales bacterium]